MKNNRISNCARLILLAVVPVAATGQTQTNHPDGHASVYLNSREAAMLRAGVLPANEITGPVLYDIDFRGGSPEQFFRFLKLNGFNNDDVLLADNVNNVLIPAFELRSVPLSEIPKSIEFLTQGALTVEAAEKQALHAGEGIVWRVGMNKVVQSSSLRTKSCAVPWLLGKPDGPDRAGEIADAAIQAMFETADRLHQRMDDSGRIKILQEERIIVIVGTETYVEGVYGALEAAEAVAAARGHAEIPPPPVKF